MLSGWKEIARYMGRGVRTVQRWERDFDLPIHRPKGAARSSVFALAEELDKWAANIPRGIEDSRDEESPTPQAQLERTRILIEKTKDLRDRLWLRQEEVKAIQEKLMNITERLQVARSGRQPLGKH